MWKNITPAQITQKQQIEMERKYWEELNNINDISGFWRKYIEYLERVNLISPGRKLLYKMVKQTLLKLEKGN